MSHFLELTEGRGKKRESEETMERGVFNISIFYIKTLKVNSLKKSLQPSALVFSCGCALELSRPKDSEGLGLVPSQTIAAFAVGYLSLKNKLKATRRPRR